MGRSVWWPRLFNLFLVSFALISVTLDFDLPVPLPLPSDLCSCLYLQPQLCNRVFHSFGTLHRIACVQLSILRKLFRSDSISLSCQLSCPYRIFLCLSLFGRGHQLPSSRGRLEDASAPQVIFCCHVQCIKYFKVADIQLKMCLQRFRRV